MFKPNLYLIILATMWAGVALIMAAIRVQRVHVSAHAMGGTAPPTMTPAQSMQADALAPHLFDELIGRCTALRSEVPHDPSTCSNALSVAGDLRHTSAHLQTTPAQIP